MCIRYTVDPQAELFVELTVEHTTDLTDPSQWQTDQMVRVSSTPSTEFPGLNEVVERSIHPMSAQRMEMIRFRHDVIAEPSP